MRIDDEICITLTVTKFRICYCIKGFAFFFFYNRKGLERFAKQRKFFYVYRCFTGLCCENKSLHTNDITYIQCFPYLIVCGFVITRTNIISLYINLNFSCMVLQYCKTSFSHITDAHQSAGQANISKIRFVFFSQVFGPDVNRTDVYWKCWSRIGVNANGLQCF